MSGSLKLFATTSSWIARTVVFMALDPVLGLPYGKVIDIFKRYHVTEEAIRECYRCALKQTFSALEESLRQPRKKSPFHAFLQQQFHQYLSEHELDKDLFYHHTIELCQKICQESYLHRFMKWQMDLPVIEQVFWEATKKSPSFQVPKSLSRGLAAILKYQADDPHLQFLQQGEWLALLLNTHFAQQWFDNEYFDFPKELRKYTAMQERLIYIEKQIQTFRQNFRQSRSKLLENKIKKYTDAKNEMMRFLNQQGAALQKLEKFSSQTPQLKSTVDPTLLESLEQQRLEVEREMELLRHKKEKEKEEQRQREQEQQQRDQALEAAKSNLNKIQLPEEEDFAELDELVSSSAEIPTSRSSAKNTTAEDIEVFEEEEEQQQEQEQQTEIEDESSFWRPVVEAETGLDDPLPEVSMEPIIRTQTSNEPLPPLEQAAATPTAGQKISAPTQEKIAKVEKHLKPLLNILGQEVNWEHFFLRERLARFKKAFQEARQAFSQIEPEIPQKAILANQLGVVLQAIGKFQEALEFFTIAEQHKSQLAKETSNLIAKNTFLTLLHQGELAKAQRLYQTLLEEDPHCHALFDHKRFAMIELLDVESTGISFLCQDAISQEEINIHTFWKKNLLAPQEALPTWSWLKKIQDSRVARVYELKRNPAGSQLFLSGEQASGTDLKTLIEDQRQGKGLEWQEALFIIREASLALHAFHSLEQPVVHGNIKASNIFYAKELSEVKVVRGGLRYFLPSVTQIYSAKKSKPTLSPLFAKKMAHMDFYMAPERKKGVWSPAGDVYSLGKLLVFLLTGQENDKALSSYPTNVKGIVEGTLAQQPEKRWQAHALAQKIEKMLNPPSERLSLHSPAPVQRTTPTTKEIVEEGGMIFEEETPETDSISSSKAQSFVVESRSLVEKDPVAATGEELLPEEGYLSFFDPEAKQNVTLEGFYWHGDEVICEADGATMCFIPAGKFIRGSKDIYAKNDEHPAKEVYLSGFLIDKYPVTWGQYKKFLKEAHRWSWRWKTPPLPPFEVDDTHPVVNITWEDAHAYAQWAKKTLVTEAQWEKAAKGGVYLDSEQTIKNPYPKRNYPWGNDHPGSSNEFRANYRRTKDYGNKSTAPIGTYKQGCSVYGCFDLAGNVLEWCADWYDKDYYQTQELIDPQGPRHGEEKVLRGGSWGSLALGLSTTRRYRYSPDFRSEEIGFRCARLLRIVK